MNSRLRRPSPALIIAMIALFLAATTGVATARLIITSSSQVKAGSLQASDLSASAKRTLKGNRGLRGLGGQAGANGANGAPGAAGAPATKLWAVIDDQGGGASVARSSGNVTVARSGPGPFQYRIKFPSDVSNCAYVGNIGNASTISQSETQTPGTVVVARSAQDANTVSVELFSSGGANGTGSFHLAVFC